MSSTIVLHSLHRPYHRPLWMVKWVCCFYAQRELRPKGKFWYDDIIVDLFFVIIQWLKKSYPRNNDGIPSHEAIDAVYKYFWDIPTSVRYKVLKEILSTGKRVKGIETQVYSTYKAVTYYHNLAKEKLHFINDDGVISGWVKQSLTAYRKTSSISMEDRKLYLQHIIMSDTHFFISQCLLEKYIRKYRLNPEDTVFRFMQTYYPIPRFDYTNRSHKNYYDVRHQWMILLGAVTQRGSLNTTINAIIKNDLQISPIYDEIKSNVNQFVPSLKKTRSISIQIRQFYASYESLRKTNKEVNDFVNLYDISSSLKMSYSRFNSFLSQFYESERMKKNIYLINIVSTIDQRKRFYVRNTPVLKIKIT